MNASDCSFEQMMKIASGMYELAEATSYMQVEYGLSELKACWDGFTHTSEAYDVKFKTRRHICKEFAYALSEYLAYLEETSPLKDESTSR